jgi:flagellar motor switch protein FliM
MTNAPKDAARLLEQKPSAPERLPQLTLALDNAATAAAEGLAQYFSAAPLVSFTGVESAQSWEALARAGDGAVALLHAPAWDARLAVGLDGASLDLLIEAMLGGEGASAPQPARAKSAFDLRVAGAIFEAMAEALRQGFAPVAETDFVVERLSAAASPDTLFRRDGAALVAHYDIRLPFGSARSFVALPVAALGAVRPRLAREPEGAPPDPAWLAGLRARVGGADVRVRAILDERTMTLGEIAALRVGALLPLRPDAIERLSLICDGAPLFQGELGQAGGAYTVRITGGRDEPQDAAETISEGESA